jgi:hypothetical protein
LCLRVALLYIIFYVYLYMNQIYGEGMLPSLLVLVPFVLVLFAEQETLAGISYSISFST